MKKINILEVGSCSLLDFPYDERFYFGKLVHHTEPTFYNELFYGSIKNCSYNLEKFDIAVLSQGCVFRNHPKEFHELSYQDIDDSITVNLTNVMGQISYLLKWHQNIRGFLILGSVAGEKTYINRIPYSVAKAGLIKLVDNLKVKYPDFKFEILNLEGYKTKINDYNESYKNPKEGFDLIMKTILEMTSDN